MTGPEGVYKAEIGLALPVLKSQKLGGTDGNRTPTVVPFAVAVCPGIKEPERATHRSLGNEDRRGRIACTVRNVDGRISAKCQLACG